MAEMQELRKTPFDGKRCLIKGDHPHAGEKGIVKGCQHTIAGLGLVIENDENEEFFVFDAKDLSWVK